MSENYHRDPVETYRDLIIAWFHPDYRDRKPIEVLQELRSKQ